jgi:hypothetical protein
MPLWRNHKLEAINWQLAGEKIGRRAEFAMWIKIGLAVVLEP